MIYLEQDFYSNFNAIAKASDEVAMKSILIDQISNIIAKRKDELLDLFKKVDIKVSDNPKNKEIVSAIVNNLNTNKKLVIGIAYLIAKDNDILQTEIKKERNTEDVSGSDGDKSKKKIDWNKSADSVSVIANSVSVFADTLTALKKGQFEEDLGKQTDNKNHDGAGGGDASNPDDKNKGNGKKVLLVLLGLAVVGGIVYYAYKKGAFNKAPEIN